MKKALIFIIALIFALSLSLPAFAEYGANLECTYNYSSDGKVVVKASLVDITDESGIAVIEYKIIYDSSVLTLESVNSNIPNSWLPFVEEEMAEVLSRPIENGYIWSVVNALPGYGVVDDDELYVELVFSFNKDVSSEIEFICTSVCNDNLKDVRGPDKKIKILPKSDDEPNVSEPDVSSTESSDVSESAPEFSVPETSDSVESSAEPSEPNYDEPTESSVDTSDIEDVTASESASSEIDTPTEELPEEPSGDNGNGIESGIASSEAVESISDNIGSNEEESNNVKLRINVIWVIVIVLFVIGIIALCIFFLLNRKGKK